MAKRPTPEHRVISESDGATICWDGTGWSPYESNAVSLPLKEAVALARIINANHRFMDREDRLTAIVKEDI